jgi:L-asparagine transporter-like permease
MGSAAFLLVYSAVSIGHMRIREQTEAKAWLVMAAALTCLCLFVVLVHHMITTAPTSAIALAVTLAGSLLFESVFRHTTGRTFREIQTDPAPAPAAPTAR